MEKNYKKNKGAQQTTYMNKKHLKQTNNKNKQSNKN